MSPPKAASMFCSVQQGLMEGQARDRLLLNSPISCSTASSMRFQSVPSLKLNLVPETESSNCRLAQYSLLLQTALMVLQQVSAFGEKQSTLMPLVHSQKVRLLALQDITQLCSPLLIVPTHTNAFCPIPKRREHNRWQWSSTLPSCAFSILVNRFKLFSLCGWSSEKGMREQKRRAWCGESIPLTPCSGLTNFGNGQYILSSVCAYIGILLVCSDLCTLFISLQQELAQVWNLLLADSFSFCQRSSCLVREGSERKRCLGRGLRARVMERMPAEGRVVSPS